MLDKYELKRQMILACNICQSDIKYVGILEYLRDQSNTDDAHTWAQIILYIKCKIKYIDSL